jgi:hypothetical protein
MERKCESAGCESAKGNGTAAGLPGTFAPSHFRTLALL